MTSKQLNILLGIVVAVLLGTVGYLTLRNNNSQNQTLNQQDNTAKVDNNTNSGQPLNNTNSTNSNTQTATPPTTAQPSDNKISGWKTFTSSRLGLKFQYPTSWGNVEENYYDSAKDGNPNSEISPKGKHLSISFSRHTGVGPYLSAASSDYTQWEGFVYKGETSLEKLYASFSQFKTQPIYTTATPNTRLVTVICYPNCAAGFAPEVPHIEAYAKLNNSIFGGLQVSEILGNPATGALTDSAASEFIRKAENGTLDKDTQSKIDEFKTFVSTFKFTK